MSIGKPRLCAALIFYLALMAVFVSVPTVASAQDEDLDAYKVRITGFWLRSSPTVTLEAAAHQGLVDFNRDFDFTDYSTFVGKVDWKFTRKNHLYFVGIPFTHSNERVLDRTITFRGQTFSVGTLTKAELRSTLYALGYQYDIIRRRRWHLGVAVQFNLFDTTGKFTAAEQVTSDGVRHPAVSSEASLLAPIPVAGPEYRVYLTNSRRLFIEGNLYGMYFFGYGNYVSTAHDVGVTLSKHFSVNAGYGLSSRLRVKDTNDRVGLDFTQKGPLVGVQVTF